MPRAKPKADDVETYTVDGPEGAPDREAGDGSPIAVSTPSGPAEPDRTNGTSKRSFTVIVGCDYGTGYKAPGAVVDDVPASSVAQSLAEGVLVPEGEALPDGVIPIPEQASYTYNVAWAEPEAGDD